MKGKNHQPLSAAALLVGSLLSFLCTPAVVAAQSSARLNWTQNLTPTVTGFAVTVDGARTDYGLTPLATDGSCGCSIALPFSTGRHTLVVIAYNGAGETSSAPLVVGPTADTGGPYAAQAGAVLTVSAAGSTDATGTITSYRWNWGDGAAETTSSSPTATHTYVSGGVFTITLTVTDDFPASHSSTTTATISGQQPPGSPTSPTPTDSASGVSTSPTLAWSASGAASYDVRLGTVNPPPQLSAAQPGNSYAAAGLAAGTTHYWQIIARNAGGTTAGPVWTFTTMEAAPNVPSSPNPTSGATGVTTSPTLTWSSSGASRYDVRFGASNPPPLVALDQTSASYSATDLTAGTAYYWQIIAENSAGSAAGPIWSFTTSASTATDIVMYASDVRQDDIHGAWRTATDPTSPDLVKLVMPDVGAPATTPLAAPGTFVDVNFEAEAGTPYTLWLRLQASSNSMWNDSVWVQFSDAMVDGSYVYLLGSTDGLLVNLATDPSASTMVGWGWQNGAYWLQQPTTFTFSTNGQHTLRIQAREDGVQVDQIVLSPSTYLGSAPGSPSIDMTIVPK